MSYGVKFVGDYGQVIIDQDHPCMHVVAEGTYSGGSVTYPAPISSVVPPFVFFSPNGSHLISFFKHVGVPGSWTGFTFSQLVFSAMTGVAYGGKWKACAVYLPRTSGWGMQVFDNESRVVFDSNRQVARYLGGSQNWNYAGRDTGALPGYTLNTWATPWTWGGAYFLVSHFNAQTGHTPDPSDVGLGFVFSGNSHIYVTAYMPGGGQPAFPVPFNTPLLVMA